MADGIVSRVKGWARRLKRDVVALWFACKDSRTPRLAKAVAVFTVGYALSPIDLIPDFITVLGFVDDAIILPGLIWLVLRMIPPETSRLPRQGGGVARLREGQASQQSRGSGHHCALARAGCIALGRLRLALVLKRPVPINTQREQSRLYTVHREAKDT